MNAWIEQVGLVAGVALPFFNIPLIVRLIKRKRSEDFSLSWAVGVWVCIALMTPQALQSQDRAFRAYGLVNLLFFSFVVLFVFKYRFWPGTCASKTEKN